MIDPRAVPDDARRFLRIPAPSPFTEFGTVVALSLAEPLEAREPALAVAQAPLPPLFGRAVRSRVRSHLAGRLCATEAIAQLTGGTPPGTLPVGPLGAPVWPAGVVGSITHSADIAAAVVAPASRWRGVGIDCERLMDDARAAELADMIVPEAEALQVHAAAHARPSRGTTISIVFSAKESVYKCLAPITGTFFDFATVHAERLDLAAGTLRLRVVAPVGPGVPVGLLLDARCCVDQGHVFTAVALPAGAAG